MDQKLSLPEKDDKLFKEFNEDYTHNAIIRTGMQNFFLFSEGYKTASIKLFEQMDGSAYSANTIVYPLIFLNRQFLELRLKELISGLNFVIYQEHNFPNGHGLESLWKTYIELIHEVGESYVPEGDTLEYAECLIKEFDSVDPKSFSFRYPVDTSPDRNPSLSIKNIDLKNFFITMNKLYNLLDTQSDVVFHLKELTEDLILEMHSNFQLEMMNYYNN
jgi:hypothetical protein